MLMLKIIIREILCKQSVALHSWSKLKLISKIRFFKYYDLFSASRVWRCESGNSFLKLHIRFFFFLETNYPN